MSYVKELFGIPVAAVTENRAAAKPQLPSCNSQTAIRRLEDPGHLRIKEGANEIERGVGIGSAAGQDAHRMTTTIRIPIR